MNNSRDNTSIPVREPKVTTTFISTSANGSGNDIHICCYCGKDFQSSEERKVCENGHEVKDEDRNESEALNEGLSKAREAGPGNGSESQGDHAEGFDGGESIHTDSIGGESSSSCVTSKVDNQSLPTENSGSDAEGFDGGESIHTDSIGGEYGSSCVTSKVDNQSLPTENSGSDAKESSDGKPSHSKSQGESSSSGDTQVDNQSLPTENSGSDGANMIHGFGYEENQGDEEIAEDIPAFGSLSPTRHSTPHKEVTRKRNAGSSHIQQNTTSRDQPAGKRIAVDSIETEESFMNLTSAMNTIDNSVDDGKAKFFRLAFRGNTYMFPCKKRESANELFNRIAKSITYFKKRPFILKYAVRDDEGAKVWVTMTKRSSIDVQILYAAGKSFTDYVKIMEAPEEVVSNHGEEIADPEAEVLVDLKVIMGVSDVSGSKIRTKRSIVPKWTEECASIIVGSPNTLDKFKIARKQVQIAFGEVFKFVAANPAVMICPITLCRKKHIIVNHLNNVYTLKKHMQTHLGRGGDEVDRMIRLVTKIFNKIRQRPLIPEEDLSEEKEQMARYTNLFTAPTITDDAVWDI